MSKKIIVDMDGTLFRFHDEVDYLERMYEKGFFQSLKPFQNMIDGIKLFMRENLDVDVYVCSSVIDSEFCIPEKNAALNEYLPEIDQNHRIFPPMGKNKAEYIPGGVDKDTYLIDDYNIGLNKFLHAGGSVIKAHNNINMKGMGAYGGDKDIRWCGEIIHVEDSPELIAKELAAMIGLDIKLDKLYESMDIQKTDVPSRMGPGKFIFETFGKSGFTGYHDSGFEAHLMTDTYSGRMMFFRNPFNAVRWLNGDQKSEEFHISDSLSLSRMQLESVLHNLHGKTKNEIYQELINSPVIILNDEVKQEVQKEYLDSLKPILAIAQLSDGTVRVYHDKETLLKDRVRFQMNEELGGGHVLMDYPIPLEESKGKGIDALIFGAEKRNTGYLFERTLKKPDKNI